MIYTESRKLNIIASLIKENNEAVLKEVESILIKSTSGSSGKFKNFLTTLTSEELDEFEKNIKEGCEQINENDWK